MEWKRQWMLKPKISKTNAVMAQVEVMEKTCMELDKNNVCKPKVQGYAVNDL